MILLELKKRTKASILIPVVLQKLIREDSKYFDDDDLLDIKQFFIKQIKPLKELDEYSNLDKVISDYAAKLVDLRYDNLKKSVKSINLEINLDKKSVSEKLGLSRF